jgi:ABC-type transporter Mla subunit MlaD
MDSRRAGLRVGLFVIAGLIGALALIFFLSGSLLHPGILYETYFQESVQGIDVGTAVKFRGVTIGQVTDIGLVSAEYPPASPNDEDKAVYQQVVVRFRVDPQKIGHVEDVQRAISHGLRVQIEPQGITGLAYLGLNFVSATAFPAPAVPWTPDSTVIPSIPSTLTQVQDAVQQVMSSLSHADLGKIVAQISSLVTTLNTEFSSGDAKQAIANANILLATANAAVQRADLPATTAAVRNLADGPQTAQILAQLNQTTAQLAQITKQLPALVASSQATINQAAETTADLQAQLAPILRDMQSTTANLRTLTAELSRNPAAVLRGAPPPPDANGAAP